jgi:hypothetical protein
VWRFDGMTRTAIIDVNILVIEPMRNSVEQVASIAERSAGSSFV